MPDSHERNIFSIFADTAGRRSEHPAIIYLGNRFSYRRVKDLADRFAASLNELGVETGQKVMMYIPNSIQWVVSWLAIQKLGAVAVPITPIYTPHDLQYIANDSDAQSIICADTNFGYVTSVLSETRLKTVIVTNVADLLPWWKRAFGFLFDVVPRGKFALNDRTSSFKGLLSRPRSDAQPKPVSDRAGSAIAENSLYRRNNQIP